MLVMVPSVVIPADASLDHVQKLVGDVMNSLEYILTWARHEGVDVVVEIRQQPPESRIVFAPLAFRLEDEPVF